MDEERFKEAVAFARGCLETSPEKTPGEAYAEYWIANRKSARSNLIVNGGVIMYRRGGAKMYQGHGGSLSR